MKLQPVHLRVNEQDTGQPTPCRIRISDASGNEYAPFGRSLNFSTGRGEDVGGHLRIGRERWFSIDGTCEIAVPPGELRVQVKKGIQYPTFDQVINHPAGKMSIRLALERTLVVGRPHHRMFDARCHFSSPHSAVLDGAAEDLDIVNLLAEPTRYLGQDGNTHDCVPNLAAWSGQAVALEQHGTQVIVNTHHRHPMLGSLGLLNCHRVVYPLSFGPPDDTDDWSLRDWSGQCHRKGGFVVWTEPFTPSKPHAGEALALAVLGEIDALELTPDNLSYAVRAWYQLLNAGIKLPIIGSSGRNANDRPVGALRTVNGNCPDSTWITTSRYGWDNVTNGPMISIDPGTKKICVSAFCLTPFQQVELVVNGEVVASGRAAIAKWGKDVWNAGAELAANPPCWYAGRIVDKVKSPLDDRSPLFGHTHVHWLGEPRAKPQAVEWLMDQLRKASDWLDTEGRFDDPKSKVKLLDTFAEAMKKLGEPNRAGPAR